MIKKSSIAIYVRNKSITPSSYYRIVQYSNAIDRNMCIREIAPSLIYKLYLNRNKKNLSMNCILGLIYYTSMLMRCFSFILIDLIRQPKYIIVSKTFLPKYVPTVLLYMINKMTKKTKLYWDFDDDIFESGEISKKQAKLLMKNSNKIIVTNELLKSKIDKVFWEKVILLPTTDGDLFPKDFKAINELRKKEFVKEIRLIWVATSGNLPHLLDVIKALEFAAIEIKQKHNKRLVLNVVCNKFIKENTRYLKIINIIWSREIAKEEMLKSHIGIMPLIKNQYSLGKGGFKLVQYLSVGLPVIASNVGFNSEVVTQECGYLINFENKKYEWINAVLELSKDWETWLEYSKKAVERWEKHFSFENNLREWQKLLKY